MADLVARGKHPDEHWRRSLPSQEIVLGRGTTSNWVVTWDKLISRKQAILRWTGDKLSVRKHPEGKNSLIYKGVESEEFTLSLGEKFVIGETVFSLEESEPTPDSEMTCTNQELHEFRFVDPDVRLDALSALPGMIRFAPSDNELESAVVDVLLKGIPRAEAAAILRLFNADSEDLCQVEVRCASGRNWNAKGWQPSRRLVQEAVRTRRQGVVHLWRGADTETVAFTQAAGTDWAFCVPVWDKSASGYALYVQGRLEVSPGRLNLLSREDQIKSDMKFAEMVSDIFGSLRHARDLQRRHSMLERFFSRPVRAALAKQNMDEVLKPRQAEVTVLFCDLRGSCRLAEEGQHDLAALWNSVSAALDIMASSIIDQDGVIGDFQGDAAMGFWGWPLASEDQVHRAARAALTIQRRFVSAQDQAKLPIGFTCGLGLANGQAIVGRLGTFDQFKVDVFGPVVNLASRLEGMTKIFQVPILVDERIASRLLGGAEWVRCRRIAKVQPFGMRQQIFISELLPPEGEPGALADESCRDYAAGLEAFVAGRWDDAKKPLHRLRDDGPATYLRRFMEERQFKPPADWTGVIHLESKGG